MDLYDPGELARLYVFGTNSPSDDYNKHIRPRGLLPGGISPALKEYDMAQFLETGPGRYARPSLAGIVEKFFAAKGLEDGEYSFDELINQEDIKIHLEDPEDPDEELEIDVTHYYTDPLSEDYAMRSSIFGGSPFYLKKESLKFIVKNGRKEIRDLVVIAGNDGVDFTTATGVTKYLNFFIRPIVDPYHLTRGEVDLHFKGEGKSYLSYDKDNFQNDKDYTDSHVNIGPVSTAIVLGLNEYATLPPSDPLPTSLIIKFFQAISKRILPTLEKNIVSDSFLDYEKDGRLIIYGTPEEDRLTRYNYGLPVSLPQFPPYIDYYMIGGQGDDILYGSSGNDYFTGGGDNDTIIGGPIKSLQVEEVDTAIYRGSLQDYEVEFLPDQKVKISDSNIERDGVDTLTRIEIAEFSDKTLDLRPGQDIVFVIDVSGSMKDDIDAVKEEVKKKINEIFDSNVIDNRVAIVTFNDKKLARSVLNFTDHPKIEDRRAAALKSIEENVSIIGGGAEYTNSALLSTIRGNLAGKWREKASNKEILLFSDVAESLLGDEDPQKVADAAKSWGVKIEQPAINLTPEIDGEEDIASRSSQFEGKATTQFTHFTHNSLPRDYVTGIGSNYISWKTASSSYNFSFNPNSKIDYEIPVFWDQKTIDQNSSFLSPSHGVVSLGTFSLSVGGANERFGRVNQVSFHYEMEAESSDEESLLKLNRLPKRDIDISFSGVGDSRAVLFHTSHENHNGILVKTSSESDTETATPVIFDLLGVGKKTDDGYTLTNGWIPIEDAQEVELLARMYTSGPGVVYPSHSKYQTLIREGITDENATNLRSLNPGVPSNPNTPSNKSFFHSRFIPSRNRITPNGGLTLDQAAYLLGYDSIEWYTTRTHGFTDSDKSTSKSFVNADGNSSFLSRPVVDEDWEKVEFETHLVGVDETDQIGSESVYRIRWGSTFKELPATGEDNLVNYKGDIYSPFEDRFDRNHPPVKLHQDTFINNAFTADELLGDGTEFTEIGAGDAVASIQTIDPLSLGSSDISSSFPFPDDSLIQNDLSSSVDAFAAHPSTLL